jgi:Cu-Zn family superoxide dismutase
MRSKRLKMIYGGILFLSFLVSPAFAAMGGAITPVSWPADVKPMAHAVLEPRSGSNVTGTVDFATTANGGLMVRSYIKNAAPGEHGFHIHAIGDCSSADAKSAGGHFNPTGENHGAPKAFDHHAGDLGNVEVASNGMGSAETIIAKPGHSGFAGWSTIIGKSIVLHEKRDDLKTQPSGDAGSRVACGVIKTSATSN